MGFSLVTTIPDICNIKCLCYKCGLKNFPDIMNEWWCEGVCCCNFNHCGLVELLTCQYFIFGPCQLTAPALPCTFKVPVSSLQPLLLSHQHEHECDVTLCSGAFFLIQLVLSLSFSAGGADDQLPVAQVRYSGLPRLQGGRLHSPHLVLLPLGVWLQGHLRHLPVLLPQVPDWGEGEHVAGSSLSSSGHGMT